MLCTRYEQQYFTYPVPGIYAVSTYVALVIADNGLRLVQLNKEMLMYEGGPSFVASNKVFYITWSMEWAVQRVWRCLRPPVLLLFTPGERNASTGTLVGHGMRSAACYDYVPGMREAVSQSRT